MKTVFRPLVLLSLAATLLLCFGILGCSQSTEPKVYTSFSELEDKRIGVTTGSVQALQTEERFPHAELFYFTSGVDMLNALRANKIDAFADADVLARYMMSENPDLTCLDEMLSDGMKVGAIFPKTDEGKRLCDEFSEFVREIKANGTYEEIKEVWLGDSAEGRTVHDLDQLPGPNGTLRMAAELSVIPFVFEELVQQLLLPVLSDPAVRFSAEFSAKDESVRIAVDYGGEPYDLEETDNVLSLRLVKGVASEIHSEATDHETLKNRITIRL